MSIATPHHAAIILAAGASRRLGINKQLLTIDGVPLVRRAVLAAQATQPTQTLVVVGKAADEVFKVVDDLSVERVDCTAWQTGMGASLRAGIAALRADIDGALVVLCDQPALTAAHLCTLTAAWRCASHIAVASEYADTIGVPAIVPRAWFDDLKLLQGDRGARDLLRSRTAAVTAVPASALSCDIDNRQDLP